MNSYLGIIKRHLMKDKINYAVVIFSLMFSIILISIICGVYVVEKNKLETEFYNEYGSYTLYLNGLTREEINILEKHNDVSEISKMKFIGKVEDEDKLNDNLSISLVEGDENLFNKTFNLKILKGSIPTNDYECLISYKVLEILKEDIDVGEYLELSYLDLKGEYKTVKLKISGIIEGISPIKKENIFANENNDIGEYILIHRKDISNEEGFFRGYINITSSPEDIVRDFNFTYWNNNASNKIRYARKNLIKFNGNEISLIYLNTPFSIIVFSAVILLICINSISMIYKLKERDLKYLSIIGANLKQMRILLVIEIFIIWGLAASISLLISMLFFRSMLYIIFISSIGVLFIILFAFLVSNDLKHKNHEYKYFKSKYPIEKKLAYSYYKNNAGRNTISMFSIAISFFLIILFLNQIFVGLNGMKSYGTLDVDILYEKLLTEFDNEEIDSLKELDEVEDVYLVEKIQGFLGLDLSKFVKQNIEFLDESYYDDNEAVYRAIIKVVDERTYDNYLKYGKSIDDNGVIIDISSLTRSYGYNSTNLREDSKVKLGEEIRLMESDYNGDGEVVIKDNKNVKLPVQGLIDYDILNDDNKDDFVKVIIKEETAKKIFGFKSFKKAYIKLKNPGNSIDIHNVMNYIQLRGDNATDLYNMKDNLKNKYITNGFTYMFISFSLVLLSVVNTIVTLIFNILSRKREFKLLSSVGMSNKQIKKMISYENYFVIIDSVKLGLLISIVLTIGTQATFVRSNSELVLMWIIVMAMSAISIILITFITITLCITKYFKVKF